ncbi:MAG TPA: glycosyltransferase [Candidatus Polarisedimenticolaceae bacterium]
MEPLSILLVSGYLGSGGGAERQITELARHLDPRRFRTAVVSLVPDRALSRHGGAHYQRLREAGIEVLTLRRTLRLGPGQLIGLARLLRSRRPDVVHSFLFSENWRTRLAAIAAPGVRVISSERSVNVWKRSHHHALERLLARVSVRIVANADAIRRFLIEESGLPPSKIVVIPNGVDTTRFKPLADRERRRAERGWPPDAFVVGHTGTMVPHKGQSEVLRACATAASRVPGLRVVLLGDGPDRGGLAELARTLGLEGRVEMPGFVGDVEAVLPCLDVYVHFSREREGCSNAVLEAMACGLPVVATDVGGNRELVEDGRTGCLVGEEDVAGVASAIVRLGLDAARRQELGSAAARAVADRFSIPRMVGATAALYESVCSGESGETHR